MKLYGNRQKGSRIADGTGAQTALAKASQPNGKSVRPFRKTKKFKRLLLIGLALLAVAVLIGAAVFRMVVRPPEIEPEEPIAPAETDGPINGEEITVSEVAKRKEDFLTLLVCGTDEDGLRTDTIIFAAFDIKQKKMHLLNIPRDTISNVKRSIRKINGAYAGGKIDQLKKEIRMLLGIPADRYVVLDFKAFAELVDAVGGLEYDVPVTMKYDDPTQNLHIDIKKGLQPLNGENAVKFMRFRQNNHGIPGGYPDGDLGRIKAQQGFIKALAKKLLTPGSLLKVPDIASAVLSNTKTDLTMGQLLWLGLETVKIDPDTITMQLLPGYDKYLYEPGIKAHQSYYVPKADEIIELVNATFNPYIQPITKIDIIDISKESTSAPKTSTKPAQTKPPETKPPETEPPVTEPPVTEPPITEPPVTEPPVTEPPVTEPPATEPPVTEPPVTEPPVTQAP